MLVPTPYEVTEKKAKKKTKGTRGGLCRKGEVHSSAKDDEEEEEEEEEIHSPLQGGERRG